MRTLYLDCSMGAAGDMMTAALLELFDEEERAAIVGELNSIGIPDVQFIAEPAKKCGIAGTHMSVLINGEEEGPCDLGEDHEHVHSHDHDEPHADHAHTDMHSIEHIICDHLRLPDKVKQDVLSVYKLIGEAESHAHGTPVHAVHFHEVGMMDAIADIAAVCLLMNRLAPDKVIASPVHVGSGTINTSHGVLPVPVPAAAYILKDVPIYGGRIRGELCTPTGAALLKYFVTSFEEMPLMTVRSIGYGMGKKDFEEANCLRAFIGDEAVPCRAIRADAPDNAACTDDLCPDPSGKDTAVELACNIDDMTGEELGYAMDALLKAGALDVCCVPTTMKKSRPGNMLSVLCREEDRETIIRAVFKYTTTIGIRETLCRRYVLSREIETVETAYGDVRKKTSSGYGVERSKPEYDDLARIADETGKSIEEIKNEILSK